MTSAKAPEGRVNRNNGRLTATCTRDTVIGLAPSRNVVASRSEGVAKFRETALPAVVAPKMKVRNTASPRPRVEAGDQPARRRVEHRGPDVRDEARGPYNREGQMAERSPSRGGGCCRRRGGGQICAQADLPAPHPSAPGSDLSINCVTPLSYTPQIDDGTCGNSARSKRNSATHSGCAESPDGTVPLSRRTPG